MNPSTLINFISAEIIEKNKIIPYFLLMIIICCHIFTQFIFIVSLIMKGKDLFSNIQQARQHINRLKKEAQMLQASPQQAVTANIGEYVNEVLYTLNKNQLEIEKKHKQFKDKLPTLSLKKDDVQLPMLNSYKKQRKKLHSTYKNKKEESTKPEENSVSFMLDNRQIRMHSYNEKHVKNEYNSDRNLNSNLQVLPETDSKRQTPNSSQFRSRHFDKKQLRAVDVLAGSKIGERQHKNSKIGYLQTSSKPYIHQFMIIQGTIDRQTQQFSSYQRVYESIFHKINEQLGRLLEIIKQNGIGQSKLDGKKLAYLCLKQRISNDELYDCLIGVPSRPKQVAKTKYGGRQGKIKAVNKIIAFWRMKSIRQKYLTLRKSTITIQTFFRRQLLKLSLEKRLREKNDKLFQAFQQKQTLFSKQMKKIRGVKRIQIHLNSVQMDEEKRLSMDHYQQRQNIQLSRIFRLRDENLIIVYITSNELSPELLNYYYRMLQLAGIDNYRERLIFMTPENSNILPQHLSTAKMLYYSSRTLNQLKIITSDLPTILYPGQPCNQLIKICQHIDCYLYSGQPQKMKCFSTKSQTKRLLKNLCIESLPFTMEMYDYGEFLNTFSVLIIKNPHIDIWVLKIDDEVNGRGIAYADLGASKTVRALLRKIDYTNQDGTFATEVQNEPQNQQVTVKIRDYIRDHLNQRLQIATPTVYRNYTQFIGRFIKKGGVIQAHPPVMKDTLATISLTFELDPDGQSKIITSFEKINGQPFRPIACAFPQKIIQHNTMTTVMRQLCDSFKLRKMFGVFTVDFLVSKQDGKSWVIGIDPYLNDFSSSFHMFDLLMMGSFMPQNKIYLVQNNLGQTQQQKISSRQYIYVPHLYHKNLGKVKIKDFFRAARLQQFNFDVANKEGVCVTLLDQLASGVIGLLAVAENREKVVQRLKKMLDFISKISVVKNVEYGKSELGSSNDGISLKDVQSLFTGMVRKGVRKDAKARAIKTFEMKQDLQLI